MAAVVAMDEWPRRSLTVARSTPSSSSRLASSPDPSSPVTKVGSIILTGTRKPVAQNRQVWSQEFASVRSAQFERGLHGSMSRFSSHPRAKISARCFVSGSEVEWSFHGRHLRTVHERGRGTGRVPIHHRAILLPSYQESAFEDARP